MSIPTAADWATNPAAALAAAGVYAQATSADGDPTTQVIAFGIAAQILAAAAPLAGQAIGGPLGALAGAAVGQVAASLASQHQAALSALTADQQALLTQTVAVGISLAAAKLKGTP